MPPRTQSALLECMEERQVTIDAKRYPCRKLHRLRDPEPDRLRGHLPVAGGATGSLPDEAPGLATRPPEQKRLVLERHHAGTGERGLRIDSLLPVEPGLLAAAQQEVRRVNIEPACTTTCWRHPPQPRVADLTLGASPARRSA